MKVPSAGIFSDVFGFGRLGNGEQRGTPYHKTKCDLTRSRMMSFSDFLEYTAASRIGTGEVPMTKRTISHYGDLVFFTPR
jgi:hypothetical protein